MKLKKIKKIFKKPARWLVPLVLLGVVGWGLWAYPALIDVIRYGDLPQGCWDGALSYRGDAQGAEVSGRHCAAGATYSSTESGYLLHLEFARGGRLFVYGRRDLQSAPKGESSPVQFALLRTPGDDGQWLCAAGGDYTPSSNFMQGALSLHGVRALKPATKAADGAEGGSKEGSLRLLAPSVEVFGMGPTVEGDAGGLTLTGGKQWGLGCDQGASRCDLSLGHERGLWRLFVRGQGSLRGGSAPVALADAFVVIEDARAPSRVVVAEMTQPSTLRFDPEQPSALKDLDIEGLRALTPCPAPEAQPSDGTLSVSWSR
jgi:hypothetical protein